MRDGTSITRYIADIKSQFDSGHARELAYRKALEDLVRSFDDIGATNEPRRSEFGAPDMIFYKRSNHDIILGYAETKDLPVDLDKAARSEQLHRYAGYNKLFLTNYLEFRFYRNGEEYERVCIGKLHGNSLELDAIEFDHLTNELRAFLEAEPEPIRSGKRLALIMGQRARRIRDNVIRYLLQDTNDNQELERIYTIMKELLVRDLTKEKFSDMYAQTLVYGLFAARYNDSSPRDFSRREASELVPASNPFLREFFAHIGGIHFDKRLAHIVDELCDVFSVSNVRRLVEKHLRISEAENDKDPIIHFYEDFLKEYDPGERKRMGAYYTPVPVVRFMVRQVDGILKRDFGIAKGLASDERIVKEIEVGQDMRHDRRYKLNTTQKVEYHKVQVLDPAVGTATFLNEIIHYVANGFVGQEGRWPAYVASDLLPRLSGFELMMAPYTIAHLKLAMTLDETGAKDIKQRLGVYLTNTLEEGVTHRPSLFDIGLAAAVTEEHRVASEIKHERPIMVIIGNPPYSGVSSNNTPYANSLVEKYKVEPGGGQRLQERNYKWINNDYVKFISFAEDMVVKNGEGIVAMITDNSYLDAPTFRGMRWHLVKTFDKIYVLDLHGNSNKKEVSPDGTADENVFDIMQGVAIIFCIKTREQEDTDLATVYHHEIYGRRTRKFEALGKDISWTVLNLDASYLSFKPQNHDGKAEYDEGISINTLMANSIGIASGADDILIAFTKEELNQQIESAKNSATENRVIQRLKKQEYHAISHYAERIGYRPFDTRYMYYDPTIVERIRLKMSSNLVHDKENYSLCFTRKIESGRPFTDIFLFDSVTQLHSLSIKEGNYFAPLYIYCGDGTRTPNFRPDVLQQFTRNLKQPYEPEDVLDYIYAVLHSPKYREQYNEFLRSDYPRIPIPKNDGVFHQCVQFGTQLRKLHLMSSGYVDSESTTYPIRGSDIIEKVEFIRSESPELGSVYINEHQFFGNVPLAAWDHFTGSYQPAQKYLKDRKSRKLTNDEIVHYQRMVKTLTETQNIMASMNAVELWG